MRNGNVVQYAGSNTTHLAFEWNGTAWGTLCGRSYDGTLWGGYYETLPEITCKTCNRAMPKGVEYDTFTTPYKYSMDAYTVEVMDALPAADWKGNDGQGYTWLPSADGDRNGLLIEWGPYYGMWTVLYKR